MLNLHRTTALQPTFALGIYSAHSIVRKESMGCTGSVEKEIPREWYALFRRMSLTKGEVTTLHNLFKQYQSSARGSLDIVEWLTLIDLERTQLTERIFMISDRDGDDRLNFYEFIISLWKFCILGDHSLNVFAFDLYDLDSDGVLSNAEVHVMFRQLLGETLAHTGTNKFVLGDLMKHSVDGNMTIEHFVSFSKTHQTLLQEVFTLQRRMRKRTLGIEYWHAVSKRRIELMAGRFVQLADLMILHSDRQLFESLLLDQHTRRSALRPANAELLALTENPHVVKDSEITGVEVGVYDPDGADYRAPEPTVPHAGRGQHRQYVPIEKQHHKKRDHSQ